MQYLNVTTSPLFNEVMFRMCIKETELRRFIANILHLLQRSTHVRLYYFLIDYLKAHIFTIFNKGFIR